MIADYMRPSTPRDGQVWMQPIGEILEDFQSWDWLTDWDETLADKRRDSQYPDILRSIRDRGFLRPCIVYTEMLTSPDPDEPSETWFFGDGHHRLAAAIDLGMTHIPVEFQSDQRTSYDGSGKWSYDDMIPLFTRRVAEPAVPRF